MVSGFIEEEEVGFEEHLAGEGEAFAPSAGEGGDGGVGVGEANAGEHFVDAVVLFMFFEVGV